MALNPGSYIALNPRFPSLNFSGGSYPLSIGTSSLPSSYQLPLSASGSAVEGSSFSLDSTLSGLGSGLSIVSDIMGILGSGMNNMFSGDYIFNDDGTVSYKKSWYEENINKSQGNQGELTSYLLNQSNERWKTGILNEANQLHQLGINPASAGSSASLSNSQGSMPSMQSGSGSGSGSGSANVLNALSVLAGIKAKQDELKIQQYNAETSRITADAGASNALASAENTRAITAFLEEHGVTPSPYSGSKEGVIMGNVFNIGSAITSAVIGYMFGKNNKNNKNGGKPSSGSSVETVVPDEVTSPSMVPNHNALPSDKYELMEGPISSGRVSGADIITAFDALSNAKKGTKEAGFWTNLVKALDGANSLEVNMGVTMALQAMRGLLFGF